MSHVGMSQWVLVVAKVGEVVDVAGGVVIVDLGVVEGVAGPGMAVAADKGRDLHMSSSLEFT